MNRSAGNGEPAPASWRRLSHRSMARLNGNAGVWLAVKKLPLTRFWATVPLLLSLTVYLTTMAPDLTWAHYGVDGGELITAAVTAGVPHPPGYPTYVLLGQAVGRLPLGSVAYRFNLLSAVSTAVAVAFVSEITRSLTGRNSRTAPLAASLIFAWTPLVWGQALIAEVYALNLAFVGATLWALCTEKPAWLAGLLLGLSVTTHLTSVLLLPLTLMLLPRRVWLSFAGGIFLGLTPFLTVFWLARQDSPVIWGNPMSPGGWWWLVSGRLYASNVLALSGSALWNRAWQWFWLMLRDFGWVAGPILVLSVGDTVADRPNSMAKRPLLALLLTASLYGLYAVTYAAEDAPVLLLPVVMLLTIPLATSLHSFKAWALILPAVLLLLNFRAQNLQHDRRLRFMSEQLASTLPQDAIVLSPGDGTIFALWYFQSVETWRPDLVLVDSNLFAFDWYRKQLKASSPDLSGLDRDDLDQFRQANLKRRIICPVSMVSEPGPVPCFGG